MAKGTGVILVMTSMPDRESALDLAKALVQERLAACVNVLSGTESVYWWKGEIKQASEVAVLIKTAEGLRSNLEAAIRACHPYELPEIIAVPVVDGLADYLEWVLSEVKTDP